MPWCIRKRRRTNETVPYISPSWMRLPHEGATRRKGEFQPDLSSQMESRRFLFSILVLVGLRCGYASQSVIRLYGDQSRKFLRDDDGRYCDSWRFSVETNDAGKWDSVPSRCQQFVQDYMTGERYLSDSTAVADYSLQFARGVEIASDGRDAWVFDIDETLLSNVPYYESHGFGYVVDDILIVRSANLLEHSWSDGPCGFKISIIICRLRMARGLSFSNTLMLTRQPIATSNMKRGDAVLTFQCIIT